ncbi:hypothetical protein AB0M95_31240 [Sphaerisporangium sp. NPDC051017]|uniref:hypothetical protein n=1 Tax=Sphaerisporangium sp. NPDC051017 TaxID=3154636 RepID=UPI003417E383
MIKFLDKQDLHGAAAPTRGVLHDRDQHLDEIPATIRDGTTQRSPEPKSQSAISATAYRYIHKGIDVLAVQAPHLPEAIERAQADGLAYVILDGTLIPIDRCAEQTISVKGEPIDAWYSGKAHQHAGNLQALTAPNGLPCGSPRSWTEPDSTSMCSPAVWSAVTGQELPDSRRNN